MEKVLRRQIAREGAGQLRYEIREIVAVANRLEKAGVPIIWENIGDPINKGEKLPDWIKKIVGDLVMEDRSWGYVDTKGVPETRAFLAEHVNKRGGAQISADDVIFFNGLGDAVARIFGNLKREARVIGPTPAYSTHSSAEAAHSGYDHVTYALDPNNRWMPDLQDLENKVRYNDSIAGILIINPDNPTGAVYSRDLLLQIVDIARKNRVFVICDEIYTNIVYGGAEQVQLVDVIGEVPGIALKGISKEYPWPGSRCGWMEVYNRKADAEFDRYIQSLVNAKMLEVCSTSLPQMSIPKVMGDERYKAHLDARAKVFEKRVDEAWNILSNTPGISVVKPQGAFYMTVLFDEGVLSDKMSLPVSNSEAKSILDELLPGVAVDKRFVYYLLASEGICVVPLTGFCSGRHGFRITMLESNDIKRVDTWKRISMAVSSYLNS
jgi:aspartate/methionine/tyrosine aminotransferase